MTGAGSDDLEVSEFEIPGEGPDVLDLDIVVAWPRKMTGAARTDVSNEMMEGWMEEIKDQAKIPKGLRVHIYHAMGKGAFREVVQAGGVHAVWEKKDYWDELKTDPDIKRVANGFFKRVGAFTHD